MWRFALLVLLALGVVEPGRCEQVLVLEQGNGTAGHAAAFDLVYQHFAKTCSSFTLFGTWRGRMCARGWRMRGRRFDYGAYNKSMMDLKAGMGRYRDALRYSSYAYLAKGRAAPILRMHCASVCLRAAVRLPGEQGRIATRDLRPVQSRKQQARSRECLPFRCESFSRYNRDRVRCARARAYVCISGKRERCGCC